jgi:phosphoglycolate phosphatase-like HAD superfamily hydrolase
MKLMISAISGVSGSPVTWSIGDFVGNTDQNIIRTLLLRNGINEVHVSGYVNDILVKYLSSLKIELHKDGVIQILPGVEKLLKNLKEDDYFSLGLLTGNILESAQIKLGKHGLFAYFPIGAFGDDALKREQLPPIAIQRAEKYYGHFYDRRDVWLVGDSVNDIKCAHANHVKCLAVASGHTTREELLYHHPHALVDDLQDTDEIIKILLS